MQLGNAALLLLGFFIVWATISGIRYLIEKYIQKNNLKNERRKHKTKK